MDLTRLSGSSWDADRTAADTGFTSAGEERENTVLTFMRDTSESNIANSVGDLLQAVRQRQARQFIGQSKSVPLLGLGMAAGEQTMRTNTANTASTTNTARSKRGRAAGTGTSSRKSLPGVSYTIQERPPNRVDIANLDRELETRVQAVLQDAGDLGGTGHLSSMDLYDPHRDTVTIIRDRLLHEFRADMETLRREPWLDRLIKCECIKITCDDIAIKLVDMLAVSSTELGHVLRKLRLSYKQSFEQMRQSWQLLRGAYLQDQEALRYARAELESSLADLGSKESQCQLLLDAQMAEMTAQFGMERDQSKTALVASEYKMEQMAETLQSLNGIFRNMQTDGTVTRAADMTSKCVRLEKENGDLSVKVMMLGKVENDLAVAQERIAALEREARQRDMELTTLKQQMARREETVVALMERESLRIAEIEKLKSIAGTNDDGDDYGATDFKEPATSVLCVKCKKSLDDISNIRAAVLGKGNGKAFQCEGYRILLPNLRGRRPDRPVDWLRWCMRAILIAKMREDVTLLSIRGDASRFPQFVYSWFERHAPDSRGAPQTKATAIQLQQQADEDRWGFYYGLKALVRESDQEAVVFWSLLDEEQGEDGMQFTFHCISMALSMGGGEFWRQWGATLTSKCSSINVRPEDDGNSSLRVNLWLDLGTAVEALKAVLVRALKPHVLEAVEAIYALKVVPSIVDPQVADEEELERQEAAAAAQQAIEEEAARLAANPIEVEGDAIIQWGVVADEEGGLKAPKRAASSATPSSAASLPPATPAVAVPANQEPTHINFFMWLRLMLQQVQAEQVHRAAAVRLMFESASVGALTPQLASASDPLEPGTNGSQLEYPQFLAIARTLFPTISSIDAASLYWACHEEGRRKVTAEVLLRIADRRGLFSKAMRLVSLPLLAHNMSVEKLRAVMQDPAFVESAFVAPPEEPAANATPNAEIDAVAVVEIISEAEAVADPTLAPALPGAAPLPPLSKEDQLRVKLGTLVHRHLAGITPDLMALAKRVPDRYRALLLEARDQTVWALNDAYEKIKRARMLGNSEDDKFRATSKHFIDGIQPFVHYRRLLATALLVRSLADNPLLPAELFLGRDRCVLPSLDLGLCQAEKLLSALEEGLVTSIRLDSTVLGDAEIAAKDLTRNAVLSERLSRRIYGEKGASKVFKFEAARRSLVARRLQTLFKKMTGDPSVPVPASLRKCLRAGYLRGSRLLRKRAIFNEPWWAQACVADIFAFKVVFDGKAGRLGLPPITLPEATAAFFFARWGSMDVAEREVHDLCVAARAYQGSSRMRLFAALIGQPCELDEAEALVLKSPAAAGVLIALIVEIHRELLRDADKMARGFGGVGDASAGVGDSAEIPHIEVLFPSFESPQARPDRRDYWMADGEVLVAAVSRWAKGQKGLDEEESAAFADLAEFVRGASTSSSGLVDVDDVLWVVMGQWAKFMSWFTHRASSKAQWSDTNSAFAKAQSVSQLLQLPPKSAAGKRDSVMEPKRPLPPVFNGAYLRSLSEALYPAGEGAQISDPVFYSSRYLRAVSAHKGSSYANTQGFVETLLRECAEWDTNTGTDTQSSKPIRLASLHSVRSVGSGTSGSNALAAVALGLAAYREPLKALFAELTDNMRQLHSPETERALLAAENALTQLGQQMVQSAASVSSQTDTAKQTAMAHERWADLSNLVSSVDELMIAFNTFTLSGRPANCYGLFPQDRSRYTNPMPVVAAGAYTIPLKLRNK